MRVTMQNLQICKIDTKIKELEQLRTLITAKRDLNFKLYEDRQKQKGRKIELPTLPTNLEDLNLET